MFLQELTRIVGKEHVFTDIGISPEYKKDHSLHAPCPFDVLIKPASAEEISAIVQVCNRYLIPVTVRGGGTGVTGGSLPVKGGVVLSCEKLNRILSIDIPNRYAMVECGVITETFCNEVESRGMYFPVVPGSKGSSFIGGNLAMNAGSPRSCKYGTSRNHVINLEMVLPTGEIIWTGANVFKNVTGFNLTQLFVGSEGVLGIITKAVLQILPKPNETRLFLAGYGGLRQACDACLALARFPVRPSAVELVTEGAIRLTAPYLPENYPLISPGIKAHVLVEWEGYKEEDAGAVMEGLGNILESFQPEDILLGTTQQERELLWSLRSRIDMAMTGNGWVYRDVDACVPPASLFEYLQKVDQTARENNQTMISFGHAMDGNIHTMLLVEAGLWTQNLQSTNEILHKLYSLAICLGGTISGEHGIGLLQQEFLPLQMNERHLELMRQIKSVFDPNHILNPGKLLLD